MGRGEAVLSVDLGLYQRIVERCFPELVVSSLRFVGGGSCRVFEVNEEWIFRFPHGGDGPALVRREKWLYDRLRPLLSLPIPHYTFFSPGCDLFPWPIAGYCRLDGVALESLEVDPLQRLELAPQIAGLMSELHGLTARQLAGLELAPLTPQQAVAGQQRFYAAVQTWAFPALSAAERAWTRELFESFLNDPAQADFTPVLAHGDFDSSNILCDPAGETVVGIIDFEETGWGDPAWDFCALRAEFGRAFLDRLLATYVGRVDDGLQGRIAFHARRIIFCELLYGLEVGDPGYIAHGLARLRRAMAGEDILEGWLHGSSAATRQSPGFPP